MIIAPVIFLTLVSGIAHMRALGELGRVVLRAFAYFLSVSTLALVIGLVVANVVQPGAGLNIDPRTLDGGAVASYVGEAQHSTLWGFVLAIIPTTMLSALTEGSILQVLFVAILFGIAIATVGEPAKPVIELIEPARRHRLPHRGDRHARRAAGRFSRPLPSRSAITGWACSPISPGWWATVYLTLGLVRAGRIGRDRASWPVSPSCG